jgi:hypothetical protein
MYWDGLTWESAVIDCIEAAKRKMTMGLNGTSALPNLQLLRYSPLVPRPGR